MAENKTRKFITWIQSIPKAILSILDWLVNVTERITVLLITFVIFYAAWLVHSGIKNPVPTGTESSLAQILFAISKGWQALLLLLIPLFYRTVRGFLERVEKFAGMETGSQEKKTPDSNRGE